jgi:TRAP transporter 4TM/12TM fusion protein
VGFTLFHLFVLNFYTLEPLMFRAIHVGWGAAIGFMLYTPLKQAAKAGVPWYDWIMVALSVASAAYVVVEIDGLLFRAGAMWTPWDVVVGIVGTLLILEFTRRAAGLALPIIACVFILYAFIGAWMPGVLNHKGFAPDRFFTYIYSEYGIFSVTTAVSSTYIVLFVTFAAFLQVSKVGDYVNDLCNALFGWARGGPAKAAVASGIMFGSISGSSVGNVVASGMVTIPMMRKVGYDRPTAAAIEATSSTGGQITPPVMGAGAFLMAEITGIPYSEIALAAVIPCLLFYIACWIHVDLHAIRLGLRGLTRDELPELGRMLKLLFLFSPIVALIAALVMGYSPFRAGAVGILAGMFSGWIWRLLPRMVPDRPGGAAAIVRDVVLSNGLAVIIGLVAGFGGFWLLGKVAALLPVWGTLFAALIGVALLATA